MENTFNKPVGPNKEVAPNLENWFSEPKLLWDELNKNLPIHFSEENLKDAVKELLVRNNIIRQEDFDDDIVRVNVDVETKKLNPEEQNPYDIDYEIRAEISIDNEYNSYGEGAGKVPALNEGFRAYIYYTYQGDYPRVFKKGKLDWI